MNKSYSRIVWENEPSQNTALSAQNLNKMDVALNTIDDRVVEFDTTKAEQTDLLTCLSNVTYNEQTGLFTFTWQNGNTLNVDLNIEKIPVEFSMSANGVITMKTADGSTFTADVASLIKTYSFANTSEITWNITTDASGNKTVTPALVDGGITEDKLQPNFLADCRSAKSGSETSALQSEGYALGTQNGVDVPNTSPYYHNNAKYYSDKAGGSSLSGLTDTDIQNPANGEVLQYNGEKWVNSNATSKITEHNEYTIPHESLNLIPFPYYDGMGRTHAGVTFTVQADGSIVANGTATANAVFKLTDLNVDMALVDGQIYTMCANVNNVGCNMQIYKADPNTVTVGEKFKKTFTYVANENNTYALIYVSSGTTVNNVVFKPTLVKGTTIPTSIGWEESSALVGKALGKNLIPFPYYDGMSKTSNGVTFTVNADGSVLINGTASANTYFVLFHKSQGKICDKGIRYYVASGVASTNTRCEISYYLNDTFVVGCYDNSNGTTFLVNSDFNRTVAQIFVRSGTVCNNVLMKPMVSQGDTKIPFEKWQGLTSADAEKYTKYARVNSDKYGLDFISQYVDVLPNGLVFTDEEETAKGLLSQTVIFDNDGFIALAKDTPTTDVTLRIGGVK